jgi:hypothetical protein
MMNLKKQSHFAEVQDGVNSYIKGRYDNITVGGRRKNKAN